METTISVLTSCFNAAPYLHFAIESILSQTYKNLEFILIDDGSTDDTLDIIRHYAALDNRIKVIQKENSGLTHSLNVGLESAKSEWIARMDADDVSIPDRLEKQLNFVQTNNQIKLLGAGCVEIDEAGSELKKYCYPPNHDKLVKQMEKGGPPFPHSTAFFYKKTVFNLGGYRERMNGAEDVDLWLRMSSEVRLGCIGKPLIKLRKHEDSLTGTRVADKFRNRVIIATAARVSHHLRKKGHTDPIDLEEVKFVQFLKWLEEKLDKEGEFEKRKIWMDLKHEWKKKEGKSKMMRVAKMLKLVSQFKNGCRIISDRFLKPNTAEKLARGWIGLST